MPHFTDIAESNTGRHLRFRVNDVNVAVVNALRRGILAHVPSAAFDFVPSQQQPHQLIHQQQNVVPGGVHIRKNTSPTHNEMLGHRMSLVPVCVDAQQLQLLERDPQMYTFTVRAKNTSPTEVLHVTSADIQITDKEGKPVPRELRDALFPACPVTGGHILLTKLKPNPFGEGGEVDIICSASVKTGAHHARWCPVSSCFFTNVIDREAADKAFEQAVQQAKSSGARNVPTKQSFDALGAHRYYHKNRFGDPSRFDFRLESECGLRATYIVYLGFSALIQRVVGIREALDTRNENKVRIAGLGSRSRPDSSAAASSLTNNNKKKEDDDGIYDIHLVEEDHTCGNLIQALVYEMQFRSAEKALRQIDYIGYHQPHPLANAIQMRIKMASPDADVELFLENSLRSVQDMLEGFRREWVDTTGISQEREYAGLLE